MHVMRANVPASFVRHECDLACCHTLLQAFGLCGKHIRSSQLPLPHPAPTSLATPPPQFKSMCIHAHRSR